MSCNCNSSGDSMYACQICSGNMTYMQVMMNLAGMAQKYGIAQTGMAGAQHTVGNWAHNLPEILMTIPDMSFCHKVLNDIYIHWRENGVTLGDDQSFMSEHSNGRIYNCYFMEIDLQDNESRSLIENNFPRIFEFYDLFPALEGSSSQRIVQFILPDKNNKLPFEDGYDFEGVPQMLAGKPLHSQALVDFLYQKKVA